LSFLGASDLTRVAAITVGGRAAPWHDIGIVSGLLGDVTLKIDESLPAGLHHLDLIGCPTRTSHIAGLPVVHVDDAQIVDTQLFDTAAPSNASPQFALHIVGVDHVVVLADDVRATCSEIAEQSGAPLKRVKEGDRGVQGFHRWGSVILEVVERRLVAPSDSATTASYWGLVVVVDQIDEVATHLGPDVIGAPKPAVQPGRRIATVRSGAGLGVPLALMSR
jgi:hypothetical protein